ncbi:MAG: hypothetical protein ACFHU9_00760 [Fluviicola sp.]
MKMQFNSYSISNISERTFERYLLADGIQKMNHVDREKALEITTAMSSNEQKQLFLNNWGIYKDIFLFNLEKNLKAKSTFLNFPEGTGSTSYYKMMEKMNMLYWYIHLICFPLSLLLLIFSVLKRDSEKFLITAGIIGLGCYYILVSGISHSQGDRLVLGAMPLWLIGYLYVLNQTFTWIQNKVNRSVE